MLVSMLSSFHLQDLFKILFGKLGKRICFIQGDTSMSEVLLVIFFFSFLALDNAFSRQLKRYSKLSMEQNLLDTSSLPVYTEFS